MTHDVSQTQASLNLDQAREWLEIVYSETPGLLHICSTADWRGRLFQPYDTEEALSYIQTLDAGKIEGIYARACTLRQPPPAGGRGGDDLSFYLPGLWGDIDIAGPGHKTKNVLPPDIDEALRIVHISGLPAPSHWIHSGGGLYPWWLLKDPHLISDLEDARTLSAGWQQALRRAAELAGYHYGSGIGDLSRVLRIPGTINRKEGLERPCGSLEGWGWSGQLYTYEQLVDALAAVTPAPPPPRAIEAKFGGNSRDGERPGDEFNRTADWHDILLPQGWQWIRRMGDSWYLRRPGKMSGGHSATLRVSTDRLYVFSEEAQPFEPFKLYDKFSAYTLLEHGGDFSAAARTLATRGYGSVPSDRLVSVPTAVPMEHVLHPDATAPAGQDDTTAAAGTVTTPVRQRVTVNGDRWRVMQSLLGQLVTRWDRLRLFNYGGVLCQREGVGMRPVTKELLDAIIAETCETGTMKVDRRKGEEAEPMFTHALPEARVLGALLAMPEHFSPLEKLSQIPFVRPDGTICTDSGYDATTKTFLELDPALQGLRVPEHPTAAQVRQAVQLLTDELLVDFPFDTTADRANALATLLTPFVRDLIPTSPLGVIDAKEAGSGKNLLGDIISILVTGKSAQPLPYTTDDVEQRKVITSAFRSGVSMLLFDEAHELEGASFARALTSHSYQDRVLGMSTLAEFPNNRTWISLGNQVQIRGDMARRVYRVRLEYPGASPENRAAEEFRHPDLRQWATDNRRELVHACLTLVRAWFANGKPAATLTFRMGSFERWQETLAGILAVADVDGFLGNTKQWRSESDFERQHWVDHLRWLQTRFGDQTFTAAQVTQGLRQDREAEHPHDMNDPFQEGYTRRLGQTYARVRDRILDGLQLVKCASTGHDNVNKWKIVVKDDQQLHPGDPGTEESSGHL